MTVCNAGPLIALAGIDRVELLRDLFDEVWIPEEVWLEIRAGGSRPGGASSLQGATWLRMVRLDRAADPLLASLLDVGEAATITLALQNPGALVLMDEAKGRRVARDVYGLDVIGTGRLLVEAKRASLVGQVRPLIEQMRGNGYWLADRIVAEILRQAGE